MTKTKQLLTYSALFVAIILTFILLPRPTETVPSSTSNEGQKKVMAIVDDLNKIHASEYVGVKVDEEKVSVDIWISSQPSPELFKFLQKFDIRGKGQPVVRLHRAPYTLSNLNGAKQKVTELVANSKIEGGVVLSGVSVRQDGEGIGLTIDVSSATPDSQWISNLENYIGVPVFVDPNKTDIESL
jgi:hypothetical protein